MSDEKFISLFRGSARGFWLFDPSTNQYLKLFKDGEPTSLDWTNHFTGKYGLVIAPIQENNNINFAAIDIDFYDQARNKREATEDELKAVIVAGNKNLLPLNYFFSKSGSIHCYLFCNGSGRSASTIRGILADWARLLGYPTAEIFPKQDRLDIGGKGSGINIPYLGKKDRPAIIYRNGELKLLKFEEFLDNVRILEDTDELPVLESGELPPCMEVLLKDGVTEYRNNFIFDLGVLYKKQSKDNWIEEIKVYNYQNMHPPLTVGEIGSTVRSLNKKSYEYLCDKEPIASLCKRNICVKRKFGVGRKDSEESGYDPLVLTSIKKVNTDPPKYIVMVNGQEIEADAETLFSYQKFRVRIREKCDITPGPMKTIRWDMLLKELFLHMTVVEPPKDASLQGKVEDELRSFLDRATEEIGDLLKGRPYLNEGTFYFKAKDFERYLHSTGLDNKLHGRNLFVMLHQRGVGRRDLIMGQKSIEVWFLNTEKFVTTVEKTFLKPLKEAEPEF